MKARVETRTVFVQIAALVSCALWIFCAAGLCFAQGGPERLELQGVSFVCKQCRERPDGRCELTLKGEPVLMACAAAFSSLLAEAADDPQFEAPSEAELKRYLLQIRRRAEDAKPALKILLRTSGGQRLFITEAGRFLSFYAAEIEELLEQATLPAAFAEALWHQQTLQGLRYSSALKASVAFHKPAVTEDEIVLQLSGSDLANDLRDLSALAARLNGASIGRSLAALKSAVERCVVGADSVEQHVQCQSAERYGSAQARAYLAQVRTTELIEALRRPARAPEDVIKFVARAEELQLKSSVLHAELGALLERLIESDRAELKLAASDERFLETIEASAAIDEQLSYKTAVLLSHASMAALNNRDQLKALRLINRSARVSPGEIRYRSLIAEQLKRALREQTPSEIAPDLREFEARFDTGRRSIRHLVYGLAALSIVTGGALLLRRRGSVKGRPVASPDDLTGEERQELRQLLAFFELAGFASEAELTQVYRQRAKEVHPDTSHGPVEHFTVLNEKYQRAKELLSKKAEKR